MKYDRLIRKYSNYILDEKGNESLTIKGDYLELVEDLNGEIIVHFIHKRNIHSFSIFDVTTDGIKAIMINFTLGMSNYENGISLVYTDELFKDITEWLSL